MYGTVSDGTVFETIVDRFDDPVMVQDLRGKFRLVNDAVADYAGLPPEALLGKDEFAFMDEATAEEIDTKKRDVAETESSIRYEVSPVFEDGKADTADFSTYRYPYYEDGELSGTIAICRDVTELKSREQELQRRQHRTKRDRDRLELLNEVVRHDIRNDMQIVAGRASMLEDYVDESGLEHLWEVKRATDKAIDLTETARDLTETLLRDEDPVVPTPLDRVLREEIEDLQGQHEQVTVNVDGGIPSVDVLADEMLGAVFHNLLHNAVVHNDTEEPIVTVSIEREDGEIAVSIADNGPGIPERHKAEIFGKGEKGLGSDGTGLGLYLVKTLLNHYDGEISVTDNEPTGAIFEVRLRTVAKESHQ